MAITLYENIAQLKANVYALNVGFDIASYFLPDEEVVVNLLLYKNIKMGEEQARLIVGQLRGVTQSVNEGISGLTQSVNQEIAGLTASIQSTISGLTASFQNTKQDLKDFAEENGIYPLSKTNPLFEEVKKIKEDIRRSVQTLAKEQKALVKDFATFAVETSSSISGASILIAPVSFNIPGAIYFILIIIKSMNRLIDRFADLILHLDPLNLMFLVLPRQAFDTIVTPINIIITALNALYTPITAIKKLVDKIISFLRNKISKNKNKTIRQLLKERRKKVRERKDKDNEEDDIKTIDEEIRDIDKRIDDLRNGKIDKILTSIQNINNPDLIDFKSVLSEIDFSDFEIDFEMKELLNETQEVSSLVGRFVYDVYLPDGRIITGLDEEKLEDIKKTYQVEFRN